VARAQSLLVAPSVREAAGVRYHEAAPAGATQGLALPLVVLLHPQNGEPLDFLQLFARAPVRARFVAPYANASNGVGSWYRGNSTDPGAPGVRRATSELQGFLDVVLVRPARAILVGYSQGAIVALALAATRPDSFTAVLSLAGRLPPALFGVVPRRGARPQIVEFHGADDTTVPFAAARKSIATFAAAGFSASLRAYPGVGHQLTAGQVADVQAVLAQTLSAQATSATKATSP
jgi:phospholipase/carboxylesterase